MKKQATAAKTRPQKAEVINLAAYKKLRANYHSPSCALFVLRHIKGGVK